MVKQQQDGALSPSLLTTVDATSLFGPVITSEAHLAYGGATLHTNNTAELSAMSPTGPGHAWFSVLHLLRFQARREL